MSDEQVIAIIAAILHTGARVQQTIDEHHGVTWHNEPDVSDAIDSAREMLKSVGAAHEEELPHE